MPLPQGAPAGTSPGLRFPSALMVGSSAALFPAVVAEPARAHTVGRYRTHGDHWHEFRSDSEGPTAYLVIGPGMVRFMRVDHARAERTLSRRADGDAAARFLADVHRSITSADAGQAPGDWLDDAEPARRGSVAVWSRKSQGNLVRTICSLDLAPLVDGVNSPAMVTLTCPGDWLAVAPDAATAYRVFDRWSAAYRKRYGALRCIWKREFQRRGAPHWHLWLVPPTARLVRDRRGVVQREEPESLGEYRVWVSESWTRALRPSDDHGWTDPDTGERHPGEHLDVVIDRDSGLPVYQDSCRGSERCRSLAAGTGVDTAEGERARDPKRLSVYFLKESLGGEAKRYQNRAPDQWGGVAGRYWGVKGLELALSTVQLAPEWAHELFRMMRHVRASGVRLPTVDARTGEVRSVLRAPVRTARVPRGLRADGSTRMRRVTRRVKAPSGAGWVATNDGAALGEVLAEAATRLAGGVPRFEADLWHAGAWDRIADRLPAVLSQAPLDLRVQDHETRPRLVFDRVP